jgi:hypothetical protein
VLRPVFSDAVRVSASLVTSVYNLIRAAKAQGLEGIIAKRGPVRTTRQMIFAPQQLVVALAYENEDDFIRNLVVSTRRRAPGHRCSSSGRTRDGVVCSYHVIVNS